jgi:omega-6 fatty acid desaturase (delta-12 desaturase)
MPSRRAVHARDSWIVSAFALGWVAIAVATAFATNQSALTLVGAAVVWPLLVWSAIMGAAIYFHHTHPALRWYADGARWDAERDGVSTTVNLKLPFGLGWLLNNIMAHPVHHLDVRIPLYNLGAAHDALASVGAPVLEARFSWGYVRDTVGRCKLYDYDAQRWMDFSGRYTSSPA